MKLEDIKTKEQLAREHREWMERLLQGWLKFAMDLYEEAMIHGYKHKEDE